MHGFVRAAAATALIEISRALCQFAFVTGVTSVRGLVRPERIVEFVSYYRISAHPVARDAKRSSSYRGFVLSSFPAKEVRQT